MNHKYLTERERYKLEILLKQGFSKTKIAKMLGVCRQTIYNEIKRGNVKQLRSDLTEYEVYLADRGQQVQENNSHNKGRSWKIENDYDFVKYVEHMIVKEKYSPYALLQKIKNDGLEYKTDICVSTLYSYIHKGVFLNVTSQQLPYKKKKRKMKSVRRNVSLKCPDKPSIENRPKDIYSRESYGHWEMDTVYSGKNRSKSCLLVLTERMTRDELIIKLPDRKAETVCKAINRLYRNYGAKAFYDTFKTITCDNGVEFADYKKYPSKCPIYFCHPYASSERGSNENNNKLIRRWVKKGMSFEKYSRNDIKKIQYWMNDYPRKMFDGLSSNQYYSKYCTKNLSASD